jgi:hypothetical protein
MMWATRGMTIAAEMVLPGLAGIWADRRLATGFVLTVIGFLVGFATGMWHLMRMLKDD